MPVQIVSANNSSICVPTLITKEIYVTTDISFLQMVVKSRQHVSSNGYYFYVSNVLIDWVKSQTACLQSKSDLNDLSLGPN